MHSIANKSDINNKNFFKRIVIYISYKKRSPETNMVLVTSFISSVSQLLSSLSSDVLADLHTPGCLIDSASVISAEFQVGKARALTSSVPALQSFPSARSRALIVHWLSLSVKKAENTGKRNFFSWAHCYSR